ncbi:hypothetical protein EV195_104197 [Tenacibaculum skagerrakense]|uniref:Protein required for attachment to host cells n=1 Tax=Tenacibaculum skagerrakense TaxID=186571 RepID=A0A4R2NUH5_9FLAO|nr:hypothetical protein [Tenacibaculum skagerrakense]TCP25164.1 hypothetical protein EV195_104197 [Tenacibaculum skagerrakense]
MKNIGIWLDKNQAHVVTIENSNETLKTIPSNIEHFNVRGGSGTRLKGGPQDVVQDSKYLEREKHQFKNYFNEIIPEIQDAENILIFGPAEAKIKFKKELEENHKKLDDKVAKVETADSMTNNQVIAWVRDFYK